MKKSNYSFSITSDIDECSAESNPCDENSDCTNIDGSYNCVCKQGFTGNRSTCEGNVNTMQVIIQILENEED